MHGQQNMKIIELCFMPGKPPLIVERCDVNSNPLPPGINILSILNHIATGVQCQFM